MKNRNRKVTLPSEKRRRPRRLIFFPHENRKNLFSLLLLLVFLSLLSLSSLSFFPPSSSLVRLRPVRAARHGGPNKLHRVLVLLRRRGRRRGRRRRGFPFRDGRVAPRHGQRGRHDRLQQPRVLLLERRAVGQAAREARQGVDGEGDLVRGGGAGARAEAAEVPEGGGAGLVEALDLDLDVLPVFFFFFFFFFLRLFFVLFVFFPSIFCFDRF